jgi:hypothetical protein
VILSAAFLYQLAGQKGQRPKARANTTGWKFGIMHGKDTIIDTAGRI